MKKLLLLWALLVLLASCGQSQQDIDAAKQQMLGNQQSVQSSQQGSQQDVDSQELGQGSELEAQNESIQIVALSEEQFLDFDPISEIALQTGEVEITGTTNTDVERIDVLFSNPTSAYSDDEYTLQTFSPGEGEEFRYVAASRHDVLDYGENNYIFRAYSGDKISETKVVLFVDSGEDTDTQGDTSMQLIGEENNTILLELPTSTVYGEPIRLGETSFTYSQIKGFEVTRESVSLESCEMVTDFLLERINSWFYWNTCREITADEGLYFNVLRLQGDDYIYERHYVDSAKWFYAVYELEQGSGVSSENIAEKNEELKLRDFPSLNIVDDLMRDIVRS